LADGFMVLPDSKACSLFLDKSSLADRSSWLIRLRSRSNLMLLWKNIFAFIAFYCYYWKHKIVAHSNKFKKLFDNAIG
jgi:hypothetical protein